MARSGRMRIAVCDDVQADLDEMRHQLTEVWPEAEIDTFIQSMELLQRVKWGVRYDLIFLDIIMKPENGIELGRRILEEVPDSKLVYVSNSREYGPEIYELNAFFYLLKPCETERLEEIRKRFQKYQEKRIVVRLNKDHMENVPFHMISYIENEHNNLLIHLTNGSFLRIRESMQRFMENLDERFLRVNRGIIVNMEAIERMDSDSCRVEGLIFMLSRKERSELRKRYNDWLFRNAMGEWES